MNSKTLSNFHKFGKVGKIAMTVLMVIAILAAAASCVATIFVSTLPKDVLTVRVTNHAEFRINEKNFDSLWDILADGFSYAGDVSPEAMLSGGNDKIIPPEDQDFNMELSFFNQSFSSAKIHSEENTKVIEATSSPAEYRSANLVSVFIFATLFAASAAAALFMLKRLFAVLAKCESPFCEELVKKMKAFGFSLLPVASAAVGTHCSADYRFPVCRKRHRDQHSVGHLNCFRRNNVFGDCIQVRDSAPKRIG